MVKRGTKKSYVQTIGASATGVTQSCYIVRYKKYVIMLDCGLYQESDIATNYKKNQKLLKKINSREIDWIILHECHIDHIGLLPALYARGCQAHLYAPYGSKILLRLLWEDSLKIMMQDCTKLQNAGYKAPLLYSQEDIEKALNRVIEVGYSNHESSPVVEYLNEDIKLIYYPANHILYACQVYLEFKCGYVIKRLGFTGDIGGKDTQLYCQDRITIPYVNLLLGESTYSDKERRSNKKYDRAVDLQKIVNTISQSNKVLIPCFSLHRTQVILTVLYNLYKLKVLNNNILILIDSPLAQKICNIWPSSEWQDVLNWNNIHWVDSWEESKEWQKSNQKFVVISASGMLNGGRSVEWAKELLPDEKNSILFCGYSSENTLAYKIKNFEKSLNINGSIVENKANIVELKSFSSHANYDELVEYYTQDCRFDKLVLVHGEMNNKVDFKIHLQDVLVEKGESARVICANEDCKIYF